MNLLRKTARKIIKKSFDFSITTIEYFSDMEVYNKQVSKLRKLKKGTLGKEIANCLDNYNLTLVPGFESHDLKHVLLDYKMTPEGEIRMQAFMIGNGNYSIPSFMILIFGAILLPDLWSVFYADFKKGKKSIPVSAWTIEKYANKDLDELRLQLQKPILNQRKTIEMISLIKAAAYTAIMAGVFGMIFCLPFLFSSNMLDLVGAGFPFVGGAILCVGGLLTLSNLSLANKAQEFAYN